MASLTKTTFFNIYCYLNKCLFSWKVPEFYSYIYMVGLQLMYIHPQEYNLYFKICISFGPGNTLLIVNMYQLGYIKENRARGFIKNILDMVTTSANIKEYAQIVHDKAVLRKLIKSTEDITNKCYAGNET